MANYRYNDGSKTDMLVKKMIPILVHWAQRSWDKPHYYSDLSKAVGYGSDQIGHFLGRLDVVVKSVGKGIPTLNALVISKSSGLPSYGFEYVDKDYDKYPILSEDELEKLRSENGSKCGGGGESEAHRLLKEHVAKHPEKIDISDEIRKSETEHQLSSADKLDVFFETDNEVIVVEVKSHISDESDITRGIFQCVKYKAVLDAEQSLGHTNKSVDAILVMEGYLSEKQKQIVEELGISFFEGFKM